MIRPTTGMRLPLDGDVCERPRLLVYDLEDYGQAADLMHHLRRQNPPAHRLIVALNVPPARLSEAQHRRFRNAAIRADRESNVEIAVIRGSYLDDVLHTKPTRGGIAPTRAQLIRGE